MKKWFLWMFAFACISGVSQAATFVEGEHYEVLEQPLNNNVEVREFFSFYCPHCYSQEPFMQDLAKSLPSNVPFKKNHVSGMPGKNIAVENALTRALLVAEKLDMKDDVANAVFSYIHKSKADFSSEKDIQNLFAINGIDSKKFAGGMKSFAINAADKQMQQLTKSLRQQGIVAVPTLIINGRYRPLTKSIKSMDHYKALVQHLVAKGI